MIMKDEVITTARLSDFARAVQNASNVTREYNELTALRQLAEQCA